MAHIPLMTELALALTLRSVAGRFGLDQQQRERAALERLRREDPGTYEDVQRLWSADGATRRGRKARG